MVLLPVGCRDEVLAALSSLNFQCVFQNVICFCSVLCPLGPQKAQNFPWWLPVCVHRSPSVVPVAFGFKSFDLVRVSVLSNVYCLVFA